MHSAQLVSMTQQQGEGPTHRVYGATVEVCERHGDADAVTVDAAHDDPGREAEDVIDELRVQLEVTQLSLPAEEVQGYVVRLQVLGEPTDRRSQDTGASLRTLSHADQ